jgi:2-polyprenyl-3-methyl-5-hydroxy-6-metoxy-1,4-benzoquinol methylase
VQAHAGPGAARNRGARSTDRALVLFLGDDIVPGQALVEHHLRRHCEWPAGEEAVLGHIDWHPESRGGRILRWLDWSHTQFDFGSDDDGVAGFGRFVSSNVSLKRELFLAAGGFDEDFGYYYEDLECAYRLDDHGMVLRYEPRAVAEHLHHYDLETVVRRFEGVASGEWALARKRADFRPFFLGRVRAATSRPPVSPAWPVLADRVPERLGRLRRRARDRANAWYYQQIGPRFLNSWHASQDLEDLRSYLGDRYDESLLHGHEAAVDAEEHQSLDEATFYRTSEMYLYDLTAFALAGTKTPYLRDLKQLVAPGSRLLDWGCGTGTDGLRLLDAGYQVAFADFDNPSTRYLRWRLEQRRIDSPVFDIDSDEIPGGFDLAYSFDVIEHVEDPFAFLAELEQRAAVVMVNFLEPAPNDTHLHRPLPIGDLLDHATARGLLRYRLYHGRSHLVAYRSGTPGPMLRLRGSAERHIVPRVAAVAATLRDRSR